MNKIHKHHKRAGLPPGTLVHVGKKRPARIKLTMCTYNYGKIEQREPDTLKEVKASADVEGNIVWLNITGVHDTKILQEIGTLFDIHPLVLEDIANTTQRPKLDTYEHYFYIVLRLLNYSEVDEGLQSEQLSIIMAKNLVISFQEDKNPVFNPIYERLTIEGSKIRSMGADYLLYALIDCTVDSYYAVLDNFGERIENLEDSILESPDQQSLHEIQKVRREMIFFRKSVWPLRETINALYRDGQNTLISSSLHVYLRDVYDHTMYVIDNIENYRDMVMSLIDTYMSGVSNRMNEVMKVLTIIATIFIPLTFIAGIYGMNFDPSVSAWNMPELHEPWGYPVTLLVMAIIALVMILYFRRKKWL